MAAEPDTAHAPAAGVPLPSGVLPGAADVLVVGCGLTGLIAAGELAHRGVKVVALEAERTLERAGSFRSPALLASGLPEPFWRLCAAIGDPRASELLRLNAASLNILHDLGVPTTEAWEIAVRPQEVEELRQSAAALQRVGQDPTWLDGAQAAKATGVATALAALRTPLDVALDPGALARAALSRATGAGATILGDLPALAITDTPAGLRVRTHAGTVTAHAVLYATGPGLGALEPGLEDRIVPVREHALTLGPAAAPAVAPGRAMLGYLSFQPLQGGLVVSGCRWASPHLDVFVREPEPLDPKILSALHKAAETHLGGARDRLGATAHILTHTCDGLPIVGPLPGDPTRLVCVGTQGFGPALAPALASGVVAGLLDGESGLPTWLSPGRFL